MTQLSRNRNFVLYLAGVSASWAGLGVADVLLLWLVYSQTGSAINVAFFGIAQTLPPIAVGLFAGVLADRYDRRSMIVLTTALQAALLLLVLVSLALFGFHLWVVLGIVLGLEAVTVLFRPSSSALVPGLAGPVALDQATALSEAATSVATTVGAAAAAILVLSAGSRSSLAINVAVFGAASLLLATMSLRRAPAATPDAPGGTRSVRSDLKEVLAFLRSRPALWRLMSVEVAAGFFMTMFSTFLVVYTVTELHLATAVFGYLIAGFTGGFFVGSLLAPRIGVVRVYGLAFVAAILGCSALLAALVAVPQLAVALAGLVALGLLFGAVITGFVTFVQRTVPPELLGRYFGLDEMVTATVVPVGIVAGGLVTQALGVASAYSIAALGLAIVGAVALALKDVRNLGYQGGVGSAGAGSVGPPIGALAERDFGVGELATDPLPIPDEVRP